MMTAQTNHQSGRRRRLGIVATVIAGVLLLSSTVIWWQQDAIFGEETDPGTPGPTSASLTEAEVTFYDYVAPRLRAVHAESEKLVDLGREKSRNLIELQRRGDRVDDISRQVNDFVGANPVPQRFSPAMQQYANGIDAVKRAIDESRSAFVSFDWDRVARAVDVMETGATDLAGAVDALERAAGQQVDASPIGSR